MNTMPDDVWIEGKSLPGRYQKLFIAKGAIDVISHVRFATQGNFTVALIKVSGNLAVGVTKRHCGHDERPWPDMARQIALGRAVDEAKKRGLLILGESRNAQPTNGSVGYTGPTFYPGPNASANPIPVAEEEDK